MVEGKTSSDKFESKESQSLHVAEKSKDRGMKVEPAIDSTIALSKFTEYLQIETNHPNPDYKGAMEFLLDYSKELNIPCRVLEFVQGKPIILLTLEGTEPTLPSILLNSHIDVVPVYEDQWKFPPFSAHRDSDGNIYARGTQDMKSVGIQYMEALRCFMVRGDKFTRTIHVSFVPDEEIKGHDGMQLFVKSKEFWNLNIGLVLDEGLANPNDEVSVFFAERAPWCTCY